MATESWDDAADTGISKKTLVDGVYEIRIKKWAGKPFEKGDQKGRILKLTMEIVGLPEGLPADKASKWLNEEFKEDWWLTRPDAKRIFFDELKAVGFDTDAWSDERDGEFPKGTMLPLAIKYAKMRGLVLQLKRFKQGDYANLRFVGRVENGSAKAETIPNDAVLAVADEPESEEDVF